MLHRNCQLSIANRLDDELKTKIRAAALLIVNYQLSIAPALS